VYDIEEAYDRPHRWYWDRFSVAEKKITNQIRIYEHEFIGRLAFTEIFAGDEDSVL
jgi:hypothetical protein